MSDERLIVEHLHCLLRAESSDPAVSQAAQTKLRQLGPAAEAARRRRDRRETAAAERGRPVRHPHNLSDNDDDGHLA